MHVPPIFVKQGLGYFKIFLRCCTSKLVRLCVLDWRYVQHGLSSHAFAI